jgi:hypothetical protein
MTTVQDTVPIEIQLATEDMEEHGKNHKYSPKSHRRHLAVIQ